MTATYDNARIERLINISKSKPLIPEEFIPWDLDFTPQDKFLPDELISLEGHPLYDTLNQTQKIELGKREVVQSMYSYAWSESLACLFFNRHLLSLDDTTSTEYRFLIQELIEEFQHQRMFSDSIMKLGIKPIKPTRIHKWVAKMTVNFFPSDMVFMSVLAVEEIADVYGKKIRKDKNVYEVLRKVSELHHIEEGRHIHYTKMWLDKFTSKAGFFKSTLYSMVFLWNIYFMRTLYVKQEIFEMIGVSDSKKYFKVAYKNYKKKFAANCLDGAIEYVNEFRGFNFITKPLWKLILGRYK